MTRLSTLVLVLVACSSSRVPDARFANRAPVGAVDDRRDVPVAPAQRKDSTTFLLYKYDGIFHRPITRTLELPGPQRALGVNALDEVPDSTWFTNRIGVRELSLDELRTGPATIESPELHKPWTVLSTRTGGTTVGFVIRDARGEKFLLKLEMNGYPELETATDAIVDRLLWAIGYNVPENHVVYVHPRDLVLAPDATSEDLLGHKRRLDRAALAERLTLCDFGSDGTLRALASRVLDGKPLGGHPQEGTRSDDPNDRIAHERRRDLRGAYPIFAWLDHVDATEVNTLDMWVTDPVDPKRHYVKHFLLDFGKSFGVMATMGRDKRRGHAYRVDLTEILSSLFLVGAVERDWEQRGAPPLRGVGLFEATSYEPGRWKPNYRYLPFVVAEERDKFWGAKLLMRFTPEQLRAAVEAGRYTDPRAAEYVTDVLIARQRATALYWFERVAPLDRFAVDGDKLCFDDLTVAYKLAPVQTQTRYTARYHDGNGKLLAATNGLGPDANGRGCAPLGLARSADGYNIIELAVTRGNGGARVFVHVARDGAAGTARVIGIWRP